MARREKKPVHKVVMTEGKRQIIQQLLQEYDIETAEDIQDAAMELLKSSSYSRVTKITGISKSTLIRYRKNKS